MPMNKIRRYLPGYDFRDDISQNAPYATPCTDLIAHDELFGQVPEILDPTMSFELHGLGLSGSWDFEERQGRRATMRAPPPPSPPNLMLKGFRPRKQPAPSPVFAPVNARPRVYDLSDFQATEEPMEDTEVEYTIRPKWSDRVRSKMKKTFKRRDSYYVTDFEEDQTFRNQLQIQPYHDGPTIEDVTRAEGIESAAHSALLIRSLARSTVVMRPVDSLADIYPALIGPILILETVMIGFAFYELYVVLDGLVQTIKAVCLPLIILAKICGVRL